MIAVVIDTGDPDRVAEALRAAVGLGLRGDTVEVHVVRPLPESPDIDRAVRTLFALDQRVVRGPGEVAAAVRVARAVEVWR